MRLSCEWRIAATDGIFALALLTELDLNSNYVTGTIPSQLSTLSLLRYLGTNQNWVGNNQLSALSFGIGERASNAFGVHACDSQPLSF